MRRERGQATVELIVVLPVVVLALLLVIQVALVARSDVLVVNAARQGARAGAIDGAEAAVDAALSAPGLDPARMSVHVAIGANAGDEARVEVEYSAPTRVPIVGALVGEPTLRAQVVMRVEGK